MSSWLAGLIGVLLGGVLTGAIQLLLGFRNERRRVRVGARLLLHEFDFLRGNIIRSLSAEGGLNDAWLRPRYDELSTIWAEYRNVVGAVLSYGHWQAVSLAIQNCDRLFAQSSGVRVDDVPVDTLSGVRNVLELAIGVLEPRAEGSWLSRRKDAYVSYAE